MGRPQAPFFMRPASRQSGLTPMDRGCQGRETPFRTVQHKGRQDRQGGAAALRARQKQANRRTVGRRMDEPDRKIAEPSRHGREAFPEPVGAMDEDEPSPGPEERHAGGKPGFEPTGREGMGGRAAGIWRQA